MGIFNRRSILYHRADTHGYHYAYRSEDISDIRGVWSDFTGGGSVSVSYTHLLADTDEIIDEALNRFERVFREVVKTDKCKAK